MRVTHTPEVLYTPPRRNQKRRRCDGHLTDPHWIEAGDLAIGAALPPYSEIGNTGWWHHTYCLDCAPAEARYPQPPTTTP